LQGNVIDLCPVGALTSKPYAFHGASVGTEQDRIDRRDGCRRLGKSASTARGREVMRILPRVNEAINEEWISDKTRFIWDGLKSQRLDRPYVRKDGTLKPATWADAFGAIKAIKASGGPNRRHCRRPGLGRGHVSRSRR
jgi:NADH-quinone oxidoreductase subunit G